MQPLFDFKQIQQKISYGLTYMKTECFVLHLNYNIVIETTVMMDVVEDRVLHNYVKGLTILRILKCIHR